ncbi:ABC transporter permease [Bailinhaonella thermotolerans]|uniref:Transport permease protein n=1 Tax=Bailinhaonella thermotolerans TaxID=1070861 RepID=A0A3A4AJ70_9ACTN|nr:ABC transporter permease [Bailinhaonella thermotolerans]RJL27124.1 ABC transporter permease [Bailinhaonella thermotolerans]
MTATTISKAPESSPGRAGRLRHAVADAWVLTGWELLHWRRNPGAVLGAVAFPLIMAVMFGFVFGSAMNVPGGGDYREFLMPGMFGQTMAMGVVTTVSVMAISATRGLTDRYRSMPMSALGPVAGRACADMVSSAIELTLMMACGLLIGWRVHNGPGPALAAAGLLLLLRFSLIWVGVWLGLRLSPEAATTAWMPMFPLTMLASTFVSPAQLPAPLRVIAEWNPLSATVTACRELFGNPGSPGGSWPAAHALELALAWPLLITAIFLPLAVRRYRRLDR